jgi:mRNA-degrading endonuclease RelE of RelBE toxin-antitoxin system
MHSVMDTTVQVRVEDKMRRQVEKLAAQERRTVSNYIRLLIERAIEENKTSPTDRVIGRKETLAPANASS